MKKLLIIILSIGLFAAGCKKGSDDPQVIHKQISRYEKKIEKYSKKIAELQSKLNDASNIKVIPVMVDTVKPQEFTHYLEASATVEPIEDAFVSAQAQGTVKKIHIQEGQYVKKGQLLVELDDALIKNNISQIEVQLELADSLYKKQKRLYEQGVASEVQYLQAKSQKESLEKNLAVLNTQLKYTKIYAPFDGIVDQINIKEGEMAGPGARLLYMVNLSKMKVKADISENYLPNIHKGDKVVITFPIYPDIKINTRISYVGNYIDPVSRTFKVEAVFNNPGNKIKPNMMANIKFAKSKQEKAIIIPTKIMKKDVNGWYVFVVRQDGDKQIAVKQHIVLGGTTTNTAVVASGLNIGDLVITDGYNIVNDRTVVKIVN